MRVGFPDPGSAAEPLVGGWSLAAYTLERNGTIAPSPFGAHANGLLSYTRDGAMSAHLVAVDDVPATGSPRYVAYFGSYAVDGESAVVTHHVHAASDQALEGQALERQFALEGDRLTLAATMGGTTHTLIWQRAGTEQT